MKKYFNAARHNPLWSGIEFGDFEKMLPCIEAKTQSYDKGEIIVLSGDAIDRVGLILSGSVKVVREDINGNIAILTELTAPELFGEVFACAGVDRSPITVQASEKSEVLFVNYKKVITSCSSACGFHSRLIENMLKLVAKKNLALDLKIEVLSKRTTREKLLMFFDIHRGMAKKFTIPYNREEMAHYLCVDRSAMSHELCKMRDEGLIRFAKNEFEVL